MPSIESRPRSGFFDAGVTQVDAGVVNSCIAFLSWLVEGGGFSITGTAGGPALPDADLLWLPGCENELAKYDAIRSGLAYRYADTFHLGLGQATYVSHPARVTLRDKSPELAAVLDTLADIGEVGTLLAGGLGAAQAVSRAPQFLRELLLQGRNLATAGASALTQRSTGIAPLVGMSSRSLGPKPTVYGSWAASRRDYSVARESAKRSIRGLEHVKPVQWSDAQNANRAVRDRLAREAAFDTLDDISRRAGRRADRVALRRDIALHQGDTRPRVGGRFVDEAYGLYKHRLPSRTPGQDIVVDAVNAVDAAVRGVVPAVRGALSSPFVLGNVTLPRAPASPFVLGNVSVSAPRLPRVAVSADALAALSIADG